MILRKGFNMICRHVRVAPEKAKKVNKTLEHVEHSGGVAVGLEFLFHPHWLILAWTVAIVWVIRLIATGEEVSV